MRPRGRPKISDLAGLISQGMNSQSRFKCTMCNRAFERMKNLNAHFATHSDEKKYSCNFPDCTKCFKQSSQLKNHLLLHAKEKPFICPAEDCLARYTHSGRICPSHSSLKLIKQLETEEEIRNRFKKNVENLSEAAKNWFEEYLSKRDRKRPPASAKKRKIDDQESFQEIYNEGTMKVSRIEEDSVPRTSGSDKDIYDDSSLRTSGSDQDIPDDSSLKTSGSDEHAHDDCSLRTSGSDEDIHDDSSLRTSGSDEDIHVDSSLRTRGIASSLPQDENTEQHAMVLLSFWEGLRNKKGNNSRALFDNACHAVSSQNPSQILRTIISPL